MPPPKTIFTAHERSSLKSTWGSQSTRLTRDSFLPFGSCQLCLLPAVDPTCCPSGDLFCRECAMTNLLAQRKEIKRMEKVAERRKEEENEDKQRADEEVRQEAVREFEAVQMGLEVKIGRGGKVIGRNGGKIVVEQDADSTRSPGSKKRKFEIDEDELKRIAAESHTRARLTLDEEKKAAKGHLPSFWVPGETPDQNYHRQDNIKQNPVCPCSDPAHPHALSLKTLVAVNFTKEKSTDTGKVTAASCPSCKKALSNATKAVVGIPCGHVLCKPCVAKFMKPEHRHHRDAHEEGPEPDTVHCYVCDADLTAKPERKEKESKKHKEKGVKPGLVEIRSEGTGFAGGGKAVVKREGVAFQV
jgi:nitric oxide synthase-interacting protein